MRSFTNYMSGKKASQKDKIESEDAKEEETSVIATRFIAFDEGHIVILQNLPTKPRRDYGPFTCKPNERSKPIPVVQWDSQITFARPIEALSEIQIVNFNLISSLEDPDENLVMIVLNFAHTSTE